MRHIEADPAGMFAVLKATKRGEVFVDTFHPVHRKEARRLARKAGRENRLIRSQRGYEDIRNIGKIKREEGTPCSLMALRSQ